MPTTISGTTITTTKLISTQLTGSAITTTQLISTQLTGSAITTTQLISTQLTGSSISLTGGDQVLITPTGGSAPYYGARSWVNFNGKGTVSIRSSQNVSSITDNGVGDYTINFSVAMPDANYSIATGARQNSSVDGYVANTSVITPIVYSTTSIRMLTSNVAQALQDMEFLNVVTFR